jgi:hypothetical protein
LPCRRRHAAQVTSRRGEGENVWIKEIKDRGFRPWLNENPKIAMAFGGGLIALSLLFITVQLVSSCGRGASGVPSGVKFWFATEDGKNLYADDALLVPPFDKDGKTFYRAAVFKCPSGQPFVNYIEKYPSDVKQQMEDLKKKMDNPLPEFNHFADASLIKKPGIGTKWLANNPKDPKAAEAYASAKLPQTKDCPPGQAVLVPPPE